MLLQPSAGLYLRHFSQIAANIATVGVSDLLTRGILFFYSVMAARLLTTEDFGLFALSVSLATYSWSVTDAGITGHSTKMIATSSNDQWPRIIAKAMTIRLVLTAALACLMALLLLPSSISAYEAAIYLSGMIFTTAIAIFPAWVMRGCRDNIGYTQSYAFPAFALALGMLGIWIIGPSDSNALSATLLRNTLWLIGALLALVWIVIRHSLRFERRHFRFDHQMLRRTFPLGGAAMMYSLLPLIPQATLRLAGSEDDLAYYGTAWTVQQLLVAGAGIVAAGLTPMLARHMSEELHPKQIIKPHFLVVGVVSACAALTLWLLGSSIYEGFFGADYAPAGNLALPFSLALWFVFFRVSVDALNIVLGNYQRMLISGVLITVGAVLSATALSSSGFIALGWLYCISEAALLILNSILAYRGFAARTAQSGGTV